LNELPVSFAHIIQEVGICFFVETILLHYKSVGQANCCSKVSNVEVSNQLTVLTHGVIV